MDFTTLLVLPDHLRKTAVILSQLGEATAEEVAEQTDRARAVESSYLNQLVLMGHLEKKRRGRKVYFYIEKDQSSKQVVTVSVLRNFGREAAVARRLKRRWQRLWRQIGTRILQLPERAQDILLDDFQTAIENRLKVMERIQNAKRRT